MGALVFAAAFVMGLQLAASAGGGVTWLTAALVGVTAVSVAIRSPLISSVLLANTVAVGAAVWLAPDTMDPGLGLIGLFGCLGIINIAVVPLSMETDFGGMWG